LGFFKKVVVADNLGALRGPAVQQRAQRLRSAIRHRGGVVHRAALLRLQRLHGHRDGLRQAHGRKADGQLQPAIPCTTNLNAAWARWHISLTTWIGDYVYRPWIRSCAAEGVDHYHLHLRAHRFLARAHMELCDVRPVPRGIAMVLQRMYIRIKPLQPFNNSAPMRVFWTVWNSSLIIFSCIFFRNNVTDAFAVIQHIFTDFRLSMADLRSGYFAEMVMGLFFAALAVATTLFPRSMRFKYDNVYVVCMLVVIFAFGSDARNQFIYFQF
jgi:hypothetical protein